MSDMASQKGASSSSAHLMDLMFRLPSGALKSMNIDTDMTVKALKVHLAQSLSEVPNISKEINLAYGDEPMNNRKHVKTYVLDSSVVISISVRGSGGAKSCPSVKKDKTKADDIAKRTILQDKREKLIEADAKDLTNFSKTMEVIEDAKSRLTKLYTDSELNHMDTFKGLVRALPTDVLGTTEEDSKLMDIFSNNRIETRLATISEEVMKHNYGKLFDLHAEISGLMETTELTFDYLMTQTFLKGNATWDWNTMKKVIRDEITIRKAMLEMDKMKM